MTEGYALFDTLRRDVVSVKGRIVYPTRQPLEQYLEEQAGGHFDPVAFEEVDKARIVIIPVSLGVDVELPVPEPPEEVDPRFLADLIS